MVSATATQYVLYQSVVFFTRLLEILIFVRIIMSWLPIDRNGAISRFLYTLTEPILEPIRNLLYKSPLGGPGMMLDFSPLIAYLLIGLARTLVLSLILKLPI